MLSTREQALRSRIERLEKLVKRVLAGAAAGAVISFAGPVVANEAAGAAFPLSDTPSAQAQVFVLTHRSIWTKKNGVPGTPGVPPLSPHEVIATTAGAPGVICRTEYSDPALRTGINDIFIDPAAPGANDENDGLTAASALKTGYELHRRWGWNSSKPIVGCNFATSPDGFLTIHILSDLTTPDSLPLKITVAHDVTIRIVAPLLAANILRTATLTDAVTAMTPAVPLGGTRLTVRDNTLASWAAFEVVNQRVRMIDGPAAGGTFQPQTDSLATPGQVQCSACQTTNESGFSIVPTTVTPAVGNTYVVEKLVVVNMGEVDIDQELNPTFGGFDVFVNFVNINLPFGGFIAWVPRSPTGLAGPFFNFYQCTIDRFIVDTSLSQILLIACYGSGGVTGTGGGKFNSTIFGGGWNGGIPGSIIQIAFGSSTIETAIDFNCVINKPLFVGCVQPVRNFAVWNALVTGGVNTGGHGFFIGSGGASPFFGQRGAAQCKGLIWGNGNPGAGLLVGAACDGVGAPQNITGTQGDLKLAQSLVAWWWDATAGVYFPAGAGIALSWAFILAGKGAAGFGGSAHEPDQNAHWVAAETTA